MKIAIFIIAGAMAVSSLARSQSKLSDKFDKIAFAVLSLIYLGTAIYVGGTM